MSVITNYEGKLLPSVLMFSTFIESDLVFAVPFALLYGIDYIIIVRPKLGKFRATVVQGRHYVII